MQHLAVILAMGCAQAVVRVNGLLSGSLTLALLLSLVVPLWLALVCCSSRPLQRSPDKQSRKNFLGQPRLLPTQVSHTRLGTGRYNYTVPHFLVGTPVGLHGHIGRVLSLDEPEPEGRTRTAGLMQYLSPKLETWFTVHAHHHLEKGSDSIGLQGKLHNFLVSQGQNPDEWPYAYLVTMPQFLGYQRNLVCFWYLYSGSRELTAMVMEVNNYWGQRKIAFTRLIGEAPLPPSHSSSAPTEISPGSTSSAQFLYSNPRHITYRGTWDKDMFISPFEKVEGTIALRLSDPLAADAFLHITITLLSPSGKPRLIGRVFCPEEHDALDPLGASSWRLLRFLPYWTAVLVITELLIVIAAVRIRSKGTVPVFSMPEVRPNNLPRDETDIERSRALYQVVVASLTMYRSLEAPFRAYLRHLVHTSTSAVRLQYIPSKSHHLLPETFTSALASADDDEHGHRNSSESGTGIPTLTLQVLTPQFYTSFPLYRTPLHAFTAESLPSPLPSDPSSRRLLISDPCLFFSLLPSTQNQPSTSTSKSIPRLNLTTSLITYLRASPPSPSQFKTEPQETPEEEYYFLDTFVSTLLPAPSQRSYSTALMTHLLAERLAFGLHALLRFYAMLAYLIFQGVLSYICFAWVAGRSTGGHGIVVAVVVAMFCHWGVLELGSTLWRVFDWLQGSLFSVP